MSPRKLIAGAAVVAAAVAVVPAQAASTKTVAVKNNAFSPGSVSVKKGDTVAWRWTQGGISHNVTPAKGGPGSRTTSQKGLSGVLRARAVERCLTRPASTSA